MFRAEALFVDLGSETHEYTIDACPGGCTAIAKYDDEFWVGRLGVTYKFGAREEVVPLK
jgi:outer membrane immunogenic protein